MKKNAKNITGYTRILAGCKGVKRALGNDIVTNMQYRALLHLYACQTEEEQVMESTTEKNGKGFNGLDGQIMSSFAKQLIQRGKLSEKQMNIVSRKLPRYEGQLRRLQQQEEE